MPSALLQALASAAGIDPEYTNWRGKLCESSDDSLLAALRALAPSLGFELRDPDDAIMAIAQLHRARWDERVPPVVHGWDGTLIVPFAVPAEIDAEWELEVLSESGVRTHQRGRLFELPADSHMWPDNIVHCIRRVHVNCELGYHTIAWRVGEARGECFAIAAPSKTHGGPGQGERRWGVFAPVYGLASTTSGETGDLATLRQLFEAVARRGGRYVATLPILAAAAGQFSPYSPISRHHWNELYLDLARLAEEAGVAAPIAPPLTGGLIDYHAQEAWRRAAFTPIAAALLADPVRASVIETWATANGIYDYAAFRAIGEREGSRWRTWPEALRDHPPAIRTRADAIAVAGDAARVDAHAVAQYAMQHQLEALASGGPVALYLDLPVGVSCDAYEVWRHRDLFLTELAAGAPPDALFLGGQNWGLPPLSPIAARREHYRYFIACLRHHMKVAGMLRIDHVMGLFRLYCVPEGRPATDGVYLRYNAEELFAIVALESSRAGCAVVGEDLGTVPDNVRPAMAHHGLFRLHVGQWHFPIAVGYEPARAPAGSVASLNTHDTATFAGWWRGGDIDDRHSLGLITDAQELAERVEREDARAALLAFVTARSEPIDDQLTDVERAMAGATADLAAGPAEVVLVALDDLALDPIPHNVPGTVVERTNWQRRVEHWADALEPDRASPAANATIAAVIAARR